MKRNGSQQEASNMPEKQMTEKESAYQQGRSAFHDGKSMGDCPYGDDQSELMLWWLRGYEDQEEGDN
jgi:ribosome modulation factor